MENSSNPQANLIVDDANAAHVHSRKRVSILGIAGRFIVAIAILAGAVAIAMVLFGSRQTPPQRQARERSFTVAVSEPQMGTFSPTVEAFGEVVASRTLDMRAQVGGKATRVSPNLVVGGEVSAGEVLLEIDSFTYDGAVRDAEASLADARLQLTVAEEQLNLEELNFTVAEEQLILAQKDLKRAKTLLNSGSITDKAIEDRELLVSQRQQALALRLSNRRVQRATIERQKTAIERAEWTRDQALWALSHTVIVSPFDGVVIAKNAEPDRVISTNEVIAQLYERQTLEVRFILSDQQYGQLLNDGLVDRSITATWDIQPEPLIVSGKISRAGAEVNAALGGVEVFAKLTSSGLDGLRPGTFVSVDVDGLSYENALLLPETALYEDNHFYVVREGRMAKIDAQLLARFGPNVILRADVPEGERIVTTRVAQAGDGLKVSIEGEQPSGPTRGNGAPGGGDAAGQPNGANGDRPSDASPENNGGENTRPQRSGGRRPAGGVPGGGN